MSTTELLPSRIAQSLSYRFDGVHNLKKKLSPSELLDSRPDFESSRRADSESELRLPPSGMRQFCNGVMPGRLSSNHCPPFLFGQGAASEEDVVVPLADGAVGGPPAGALTDGEEGAVYACSCMCCYWQLVCRGVLVLPRSPGLGRPTPCTHRQPPLWQQGVNPVAATRDAADLAFAVVGLPPFAVLGLLPLAILGLPPLAVLGLPPFPHAMTLDPRSATM
jgi:hypothetical protein